ncbi:RdgB/HAM1 family non-canonical purine NTP pyrophosphatase [Desulfovibrio legallii]|jgi:XTP/dITP diphosphohydrolase|uniref:dITP/XTP pyrophosphatase n=1 Tax=Desulfovibrio legallii TaxID=571438 RepID=A0A1G7M7Q8_9BACT|nr:RdgB/HAM1 family non-canonical purine NTP pyrophosphatase [Desulfovibrio legallii]SDF57731.1 XTP/dITP diphosphohydrolase [Desulfovibrio legallii]
MTAALRIVLATHNAGKVRELAEPLAHAGVEVLGLAAFPEIGEIDEYGLTFEENARIKAETVARHTGLVSVADDSGLEVDALDGAPGVHSARYADDWPLLPGESRDARNMRKLLHALAAVPEARRACRYVCCMTAVTPDGRSLTTRGTWEGRLLAEQRGSNGFGYDPLFFDPTLGLTAAQMTPEQKNARSHRGKALRALLEGWAAFVRA